MNQPAPFLQRTAAIRRQGGIEAPMPLLGRRMWLITLTDLVSLMLAFFVVLFAMSAVKVELWGATATSLSRTLDPMRAPPPVAARNAPTATPTPALDLDYLAAVLERASQSAPELVETRLIRVPDGLILALRGKTAFAGEGAELSSAAATTLSTVGAILGNVGNRIGVRLRGDPAAPLPEGYESAWELALARAAAVANALRAAGYDRDIVAYGLTDAGSMGSGDRASRDERARIEILIMAEVKSGS